MVHDSSLPTLVTAGRLAADLQALGVRPGQVVMLHASLRAVGWLVGGPDVVIQSLLALLGPDGTLMMYVSWEEWERALVSGLAGKPLSWQEAYLTECPPFDAERSRAERRWSILTEYLRTWPEARRSDHPTASVAAVGALAEWLTAGQSLNYGYGRHSPFAKLCQIGGQVLLLGAPFTAVTLLHHAEHIAPLPHKRVVHNTVPLLRDGRRQWITFEEFDTTVGIVEGQRAEDYFPLIVNDFLGKGNGRSGKVGAAESYLLDAAGLVSSAVTWLGDRFGAAGPTAA